MVLLVSLISVLAETETGNVWQDFLSVAFDPAHILAELFFTIVFDGLILALGWGILVKKIMLPRLKKQLHDEIDAEHGVTPHD